MLRKTIEGYLHEEFIYCRCQCGFTRSKYDNNYRVREFINNHYQKINRPVNYVGGYIESYGYRMIWKPNHHFANSRGFIREHRIIFEEHYECCLLPWGTVHHKNISNLTEWENKHDNRIENLEGMSSRQHKSLHGKNRKTDMSNRSCLQCDSKLTHINKYGHSYWHRFQNGFICHSCYNKYKYHGSLEKKKKSYYS